MTPIPTPYDITPIPYVPWEPGILHWAFLILALGALFGLGLALIRKKEPSIAATRSIFDMIRTNVEEAIADFERTADTVHLTRLSLDIRNFLALVEVSEARSLTASELAVYGKQSKVRELTDLALALADLDQFEYSPTPSSVEGKRLAEGLGDALKRYASAKQEELLARNKSASKKAKGGNRDGRAE